MIQMEHATHGASGKEMGGTSTAPGFDGTQPCAQTDPELFFPEKTASPSEVRAALNVCNECTFKTPCLEYALKSSVIGIWGGTTDMQRKSLKRKRRVA
jgi:WhiB family redox-sensing transcriptional regulator